MGDANPIRTLGDYSKPSHEGYRNTIELPEENNVFEIDRATGGKLHNKSIDESWEIIENLALYDHESWNDSKNFGDEINDKMEEMFGLLKELTTNRAPKKVLIREEAKYPITKNINSISLTKDASKESREGE
ncbi:hypothetical protein Tco_0411609 [Tanacetum coccineum]